MSRPLYIWAARPGHPASRHVNWSVLNAEVGFIRPTRVYVIAQKSDQKIVKIGIAARPIERLSGLQTANPFPLTLIYQSPEFSRKAARVIETECHEVLREMGMAIQGEWFSVKADAAVKLVKTFEKTFLPDDDPGIVL